MDSIRRKQGEKNCKVRKLINATKQKRKIIETKADEKELALEEEKNRRQRKPKRKEKFEFQSDNIDAELKDERKLAIQAETVDGGRRIKRK